MRTTIDGSGRVVVPKVLRDALGLRPGSDVEITLRDGHIEIEPTTVPMHLVDHDGITVAETDAPLPTLSTEQVREVLERVRR